MTVAEETLPRWDLDPFYPGLESREFRAAHEGFGAGVARLAALYDTHDVRDGGPVAITDETVSAFEEVVDETNALQDLLRLLNAYLYGFITTDARNDGATALHSQLLAQTAPLRALSTRFAAWVARLGAETLIERSQVAADHAWPLRKAEFAATHQMSEAEEGLAAELNLTGGAAWNRLHGDVTARLTANVNGDELAMTVVRNLAMDADPALRKAAYDAELDAWERSSVPLAAAMNGIKGEANVVNRRRGWDDSLAPALFFNAVDRSTLGAMQSTVVASFPDFRRYLRAKARLLGHSGGLPWWDLFAPVGDPHASACSWDDAVAHVRDAFASFSPALVGLADRAFAERWVDAEAHDGKRGGAFCMSLRDDESRVLLNWSGTFDGVSTLAHELGHAYHNTNLAGRTAMQRQTPVALAETASIFCETILVQSGLAAAAAADDRARQLVLLDTDLQGAAQIVVDIHSRFLFEKAVFEQRAERALSVRELCDHMVDAQLATYGDGLDPDALHPYMWAVKPHYYSTAYYNWPYTFGLLFGIGLYARYTADPDRFRLGYDDMLSATGLGDAAELAARFDIDVRDEAFWTDSLDVIRSRIADYEAVTARFGGSGEAR